MPVTETKPTQEQQNTSKSDQEKRESNFAQDIIKTLDLPTSIASAVDNEVDKPELTEDSEEISDDSSESKDVSSDEDPQEVIEDVSQDTSDALEDKSKDKVQRRIDELTREKKLLEARLSKLEANTKSEPKDSDIEKLERMSTEELHEVKKKILRAQRTAPEDQLDGLFELEEKVVKTIENAPRRFNESQVSRFNEAVGQTTDLSDKELQVVFGHAKNIYSSTPSFQKSIDGQAESWNLALEHYKEMNKLTVGKTKVNELERKVNDLKKKTSLETAVQKGNSKISDEAKLYNRARVGTSQDKQAFLKKRMNTDALIPEEYRNK